MLRVIQRFIPIIIMAVNFVMVLASFSVSYVLRYGRHIPDITSKPFRETGLVMALIYIIAFSFVRLFQKRFRSHWEVIRKVSCGMIVGAFFSFGFLYVFREKCW